MVQFVLYGAYSIITVIVLLYGLYSFLFPRFRARWSIWRLIYRAYCMIRHRPAKPVARWRICWARGMGAVCLFVGCVWVVNLHPQLRHMPQPLYDPVVHHWLAENADGSPEEARVLQQLDEVTRKEWHRDDAVALCAGVVFGGKTYVLNAGRKTLDQEETPTADTEFQIGSITKVFTCTALSTLIEENQVSLDDPISALLPGWAIPEYQGRKITVRDLATHRSGLPRMPDVPMQGSIIDGLLFRGLVDPYRNGTPEYVREFLAQYTLPRVPGEGDEYSNLGMGLLGYALSQKTGQPYASLIKQRILDPLGMHDTGVQLNAEQEARFAQGYISPITLGTLLITFPMRRWNLAEGFQGCGSINSTVHDMLKFVHANIEAPEGPLGKALAHVQEPLFDDSEIKNCKVGLGLFSQKIDGLDDVMHWHNGGTGGYNSFMAFSKQHKIGVIILATGICEEKLGHEILKVLAKTKNSTKMD